jgi:indoleamine 2,3-dioxygenase
MNLTDYEIDPERGFLPNPDPLTELPPYFAAWDGLAAQLPALLMAGQLRPLLAQLPVLDAAKLENTRQLNRAMMLLSALGNAYVWGGAEPALRLPAGIAVPWWHIAETLGRPPITAHASLVLNNWRRLDRERPIVIDNIASLQLFLGGVDERWFFLLTVAIEAAGAPAIGALVQSQTAVIHNDIPALIENLHIVATALQAMVALLERMPEQCDPYIFYHRVRPFVASWPEPGVVYEGVSPTPQLFAGGSAAQSALLQAIDAGLAVVHEREETRPVLQQMRLYMPIPHRQFVTVIEQGTGLRPFILARKQSHPVLADAYNDCLQQLSTFRQKHIEISVRYILHQAPDQEAAKGTGGTSFVPFLSEARKETKNQLIK